MNSNDSISDQKLICINSSVLAQKNTNICTQNPLLTKQKKSNFPFLSLIKKPEQVTSKKPGRMSYSDYSKVLQSFNKRVSSMYQQQEHEHDHSSIKTKAEYPDNNDVLLSNQSHLNRQSHEMITPFNLQQPSNSCSTPMLTSKKWHQQSNEEGQQGGAFTKVRKQSLSSYEELRQIDPYLVQVGSELDQQHRRQKETILQQTFMKRYMELIEREKQFQKYQALWDEKEQELQSKVHQAQQQTEQAKSSNQELLQQINQIKEQHQNQLSITTHNYTTQQHLLTCQLTTLQQTLTQKDQQITNLHSNTIPLLQHHLDQTIQQNFILKQQVDRLVKEVNGRVEEVGGVEGKYRELVETLEGSLKQTERENAGLVEDLERVGEQLSLTRQRQTQLKKNLTSLTTQHQSTLSKLTSLTTSFKSLEQESQLSLEQHNLRYLQQIKQKNSIIDQYQQAREHQGVMSTEMTQLKQDLLKWKVKGEDAERDLKTERVLHLEQCQQYQRKLREINEKGDRIERELAELRGMYDRVKEQKEGIIREQQEQLNRLKQQLTNYNHLLTTLQPQLSQLTLYKQQSLTSLQQTRNSYSQLITQLKTQLQKAKEIIKSKNQQISQIRSTNNGLREEVRELKCGRCKLENEISQIAKMRKEERETEKEVVTGLRQQLKSVIQEKQRQRDRANQAIVQRQKAIQQLTAKLNNKYQQVLQLKLNTQSTTKENAQLTVSTQQLRRQLQSLNAQIDNQRVQHQTQLTQIKQTLNKQNQQQVIAMREQINQQKLQVECIVRQKDERIAELEQQLVFEKEELSKLTGMSSQLRRENIELTELTQELTKLTDGLNRKVQCLQVSVNEQQYRKDQIEKLYQQRTQLLMNKLEQRHSISNHLHDKTNSQSVYSPSTPSQSTSTQTTPQSTSNPSTPNPTTTNPHHLPNNPSRKDIQLIERKYLNIIESMKVQFMDLTLQFKERSSHQQELRLMLQRDNQQLRAELLSKSDKHYQSDDLSYQSHTVKGMI